MKAIVLLTGLALTPLVVAAESQLNCDVGPVNKTFGGTRWLVYACNDNRSVVAVSAPGNPAMPFYFMFAHNDSGYRLVGEGTGDKKATEAAYQELNKLKDKDIMSLVAEAKKVAKK